MKTTTDALSGLSDLDAEAIYKALCKVQETTRGEDGPGASISRFVQVVVRSPSGEEDTDDFPDFAKEAAEASPEAPAQDAKDVPGEAATPDAVMTALLQTLGEYQGLLRRYNRDFDEVLARRARGERERDDETIQRLREAQALLVKYPVAGQAAFAALVREGRRFAKTKEGQRWKRRLAPSPVLAHAKTLFEGVTRGLVTEGGGALPSVYIDALVRALDRDLEGVLAEVEASGDEP